MAASAAPEVPMVRSSHRSLLPSLLLLCLAAPAPADEAIEITTGYQAPEVEVDLATLRRLADEALRAEFEVGRAAAVKDLPIERDTGTLVLEEGWLFLKEPVLGLVSDAVFFGKARFRLDPPLDMEKGQVRRFLGTETIDLPITRADIGFTSLELQSKLQALPFSEEEAAKARADNKACDGWASAIEKGGATNESEEEQRERQYQSVYLALGLFDRLLDPEQEGYVGAQMWVKVGEDVDRGRAFLDRLSWSVTPDEFEEVSVAARFDHGRDKQWSRVCSFSLSDQYRGRFKYAATSPGLEKKRTMEVTTRHNDLVLDFEPRSQTDVRMRARLDLEVLEDGLRMFTMTITPYMKATAGRLDGKPIDIVQPAIPGSPWLHAPSITVLLPEPLPVGAKPRLEIDLEGKLLETDDGWSYLIREMDRWYPKPGSSIAAPATFDTTMILPDDFQGVVNGEQVDCREEDLIAGKSCYRFVTRHPIDLAFFNLGRDMKVDRGVAPNAAKTPVEVWTNPNAPLEYRYFDREGSERSIMIHTSKTAPAILNKARLALAIYEEWFGPFPFAKFAITPHPRGLGRGGASMLLLANQAFVSPTDNLGQTWTPWSIDAFVSHETAHQWWGNIAGIRGDRDQWFSEGFADYASLIYLEYVDGVNGTHWRESELKEWHRKLTEDDGYMNEVTPLCLGNRYMSAENRPGYEWRRQDFMYNKGGFVMHMLRVHARHLTGDKEKGDALFRQAIRNFIDEFHFGFPSNLDMQKSLSRSYGTDLSWFFKQWVYGMGLPKLQFSHQLTSHSEGGTLLRGRVRQRQDGEPFQFPVAVYVRQGKGKKAEEAHFYQWIDGRDVTFEVGPLPWRPDEVTLNDDLGVLAIVDEVDWSEQATGQ